MMFDSLRPGGDLRTIGHGANKVIASHVRILDLQFHPEGILTYISEIDGSGARDYLDGTRGHELTQKQTRRVDPVRSPPTLNDYCGPND
jgi:hypothetical protein